MIVRAPHARPVVLPLAMGIALAGGAAVGVAAAASKRVDTHRTPGGPSPFSHGPPESAAARTLASQLASPSTADIQAYGLRDDTGHGMDTLKVIDRPGGGYLGVSHTTVDGVFQTRVSTSDDLVHWQMQAPLGAHASQPAIAPAPDSSFVVAWEVDSPIGNHVKVARYATERDLLAGRASHEFDAPRSLARNEGTPNLESISIDPDGRMRIELGIHYYRQQGLAPGVDRQARATLVGFEDWSARVDDRINEAFEARPFGGNLGDRDTVTFGRHRYSLVEVQQRRNDFATWGVSLLDHSRRRITPFGVETRGASASIANPTVSRITLPDGTPGMVATYFVFNEGSAPGEAGTALAAWRAG